ncbi:MAG: lipocalin family protein [Bacteroidales bacterium]|nr:lipocalin family protein [Bacteroidales bacterium]
MKKVLFVLSLFLCLSCGRSTETLILGKWVLTKAECENFNEFASAKEQLAVRNIEQNIAQIKRNLGSAQNAGEKEKMQNRISELAKEKQQVGNSIRTEIKAGLKATEGNMSYKFNESGRFSVSYDSENLKGSYKIDGDTISIVLDNQENDRFVIKNLTASTLTISNIQEDFQKESSMKMVLSFKKN